MKVSSAYGNPAAQEALPGFVDAMLYCWA